MPFLSKKWPDWVKAEMYADSLEEDKTISVVGSRGLRSLAENRSKVHVPDKNVNSVSLGDGPVPRQAGNRPMSASEFRQGSSDPSKKFSIVVQDYERNLSVLRKERDHLHEENTSLRRAIETTTKKLEAMEIERAYSSQLRSRNDVSSTVHDMIEKLSTCQKKIKSLEDEKREIQQAHFLTMQDLTIRCEAAERKVAELKGTISSQERKLHRESTVLSVEMQRMSASHAREVEILESKLQKANQVNQVADELRREWEKEKDAMRRKLQSCEQNANELRKLLGESEATATRLRAELEAARNHGQDDIDRMIKVNKDREMFDSQAAEKRRMQLEEEIKALKHKHKEEIEKLSHSSQSDLGRVQDAIRAKQTKFNEAISMLESAKSKEIVRLQEAARSDIEQAQLAQTQLQQQFNAQLAETRKTYEDKERILRRSLEISSAAARKYKANHDRLAESIHQLLSLLETSRGEEARDGISMLRQLLISHVSSLEHDAFESAENRGGRREKKEERKEEEREEEEEVEWSLDEKNQESAVLEHGAGAGSRRKRSFSQRGRALQWDDLYHRQSSDAGKRRMQKSDLFPQEMRSILQGDVGEQLSSVSVQLWQSSCQIQRNYWTDRVANMLGKLLEMRRLERRRRAFFQGCRDCIAQSDCKLRISSVHCLGKNKQKQSIIYISWQRWTHFARAMGDSHLKSSRRQQRSLAMFTSFFVWMRLRDAGRAGRAAQKLLEDLNSCEERRKAEEERAVSHVTELERDFAMRLQADREHQQEKHEEALKRQVASMERVRGMFESSRTEWTQQLEQLSRSLLGELDCLGTERELLLRDLRQSELRAGQGLQHLLQQLLWIRQHVQETMQGEEEAAGLVASRTADMDEQLRVFLASNSELEEKVRTLRGQVAFKDWRMRRLLLAPRPPSQLHDVSPDEGEARPAEHADHHSETMAAPPPAPPAPAPQAAEVPSRQEVRQEGSTSSHRASYFPASLAGEDSGGRALGEEEEGGEEVDEELKEYMQRRRAEIILRRTSSPDV